MPETLRHSPLRSSTTDLWVGNFKGATASSTFGFTQLNGLGNYKGLVNKARNQLGNDYDKFLNDFINYTDGVILCVNTTRLLSNDQYADDKMSEPIFNNLKFSLVKMPEEFKGNKTRLSSPYSYGERIRISAIFEKVESLSVGKKIRTLRDTNIKGRSIAGQGGGTSVGIGVWS